MARLILEERHAAPAREARIPDGLRIYAVGDLHGRADLFDRLAERVAADLRQSPHEAASAIFLGDYIDRGPDSFGVIDRLASGRFPTPAVCLRGNHEAIFLQFLEDETVLDDWRRFGALETLSSYGVDVSQPMRGRGFKEAQAQLQEKLPPAHLEFLQGARLSLSLGDYFFCHAGVRPQVPLARQQEQDLLWIRQEFLGFPGDFGKIVVHGHTPSPEPQLRPNRIGVDTGAYATGRLACLVLEGAERRWLWA